MTISGSGFGEPGGEGFPVIRKPNEGSFSLVLPSGIPMPFKEAPGADAELVVNDCVVPQYADAVSLSAELELVLSDCVNEQTAEAIVLSVTLVVADATNRNFGETVFFPPSVSFADEDVVFQDGDVVFEPLDTKKLIVASGVQDQDAESVTLELEFILAVSDGAQAQYVDSVSLGEDQAPVDLTVADGTQVQQADGGSENVFTQEHVAAVFDSTDEQTAETAELEQEHNLTLYDSANEQTAGAIILGVDGIDNVLADDCSQEQYTDSVTLTVISKVGRQKPLMARLAQIPVQEEQPEDEFYLSYYLRVASGDVGNVADTVQLSESQEIGARSTTASIADNAANVITLTQKRRKRFVQEDEIILLAA